MLRIIITLVSTHIVKIYNIAIKKGTNGSINFESILCFILYIEVTKVIERHKHAKFISKQAYTIYIRARGFF